VPLEHFQGSQPGSTGIGFAIPSATIADALQKIHSGNGVPSTSSEASPETPRSAGSEGGEAESPSVEAPGQVAGEEEGAAGNGRAVIVP
jgi:hypothetical protein